MFSQLLSIDFFTEIPSVEKPIFFFSGRHDYHVPSMLNFKYFEHIQAPQKEFIWFENAGHLPIYEENERFCNTLVQLKSQLNVIQ